MDFKMISAISANSNSMATMSTSQTNNLFGNGELNFPKTSSTSNPEKHNVHSAVLGMLSLSQSQQTFANPNYGVSNQQQNFQSSTSTGSARHESLLTPPGSPEEDSVARIVNVAKTPSKPQPINNGSHLQNFQMSTSQPNFGPTNGMLNCFNDFPQAASVSQQISNLAPFFNSEFYDAATSMSLGFAGNHSSKRQRGEKRTIPKEQKDEKYFERRMRNNMAAKKSRDVRKQREDEIALRAAFLEKENAILSAQLRTLKEEMESLNSLLYHKRQIQIQAQMQQQHQASSLALG